MLKNFYTSGKKNQIVLPTPPKNKKIKKERQFTEKIYSNNS